MRWDWWATEELGVMEDRTGRKWHIYFIGNTLTKEPLEHLTRCNSHHEQECDCYDGSY